MPGWFLFPPKTSPRPLGLVLAAVALLTTWEAVG